MPADPHSFSPAALAAAETLLADARLPPDAGDDRRISMAIQALAHETLHKGGDLTDVIWGVSKAVGALLAMTPTADETVVMAAFTSQSFRSRAAILSRMAAAERPVGHG